MTEKVKEFNTLSRRRRPPHGRRRRESSAGKTANSRADLSVHPSVSKAASSYLPPVDFELRLDRQSSSSSPVGRSDFPPGKFDVGGQTDTGARASLSETQNAINAFLSVTGSPRPRR